MNKSAEKEFRELELYLQQAEEEIGRVLSTAQNGEPDFNLTLKDEGHTSMEQSLDDQSDLDDILCHYDNMEFYASKNRNSGSYGSRETVTRPGEEVLKHDLDNSYGRKSGDAKSASRQNNNENVQNELGHATTNSNTPASKISDNFNTLQDFTACENSENRKENSFSKGDTNCSRSLTCKEVKNVSQGSLVCGGADSKYHTHNLSNCKTPDATCCISGKLASMNSQEVSPHLEYDGSRHTGQFRSVDKVISQQNLPINLTDMQIDRNHCSNHSVDKNKLDNIKVDGKMGDCSAVGMQCEKLGSDRADESYSEISEFLEEINMSLDELISEGESGISDDSASIKWANTSSECSSRGSIVSKHEINTESVSAGCKNDCKPMTSENSVGFKGEDVVETDSGYYWLTCSIDEATEGNVEKQDCDIILQNDDDTASNYSISEECKHFDELNKFNDVEVLIAKDKKKVDSKTEDDKSSYVTNSVQSVGSLTENSNNVKLKEEKAATNESNIVNNSRDNLDENNIKDYVLESHIRNSLHLEQTTESTEDPGDIPSIMTTSAPNFLSLDRAALMGNRITRDDSHVHSVSDEHLPNTLKRKYSAPPSFCKVYKVVSLDIPKMDITWKSENMIRFGDASKECSGNTDKKVRNETCVKDVVDLYSKTGRKVGKKVHAKSSSEISVDDEVKYFKGIKSVPKADSGEKKDDEWITSEMNTSFEPPAMFQDKPDEVKVASEIHMGPILEPPPAFASGTNETSMETIITPPTVWDPGVSTVAPPGGVGTGQVTPDRKCKHPATPPPPSVDRIEKLISSTLNQHKHRKFSADGNSGIELLKPQDVSQRKSADSDVRKSDTITDHNGNSSVLNFDLNLFQKSCSAKGDIDRINITINESEKCLNDKKFTGLKSELKNMHEEGKNCREKGNKLQKENSSAHKAVSNNMLDLLDTYHVEEKEGQTTHKTSAIPNMEVNVCHRPKVASIATNTTDSLLRGNVTSKDKSKDTPHNSKFPGVDDSCLYARVDKKSANNQIPTKMEKSNLKVLDTSLSPPPIPPRTSSQNCRPAPPIPQRVSSQKKHVIEPFKLEHTAELEVMFNSLSPVLLRRSSSTKRSNRSNGSSNETSPEVTPHVSPRVEKSNISRPDKVKSSAEWGSAPSESLFMDAEMARTWHGATSSNWAQFYGPQLRAMMKELNQLTNGDVETSHDSLTRSDEDFKRACKTLPSKSLLDEMHKKLCADQYWNSRETEIAKNLVLLRLKSNPPVKPKRSQSFNIRMGTGKSTSSASSKSSLLPRVSERVRIKTRPDVQYSPRPAPIRALTPEAISTESRIQTQSSKKEDAEIEAIEACRWLRETGFPQYAQLYEDGSFPVDIESVEKDHDFLDKEDIQSLFRRLNTLNKCAIMKIGTPTKKESEDSDDEDQCALSDKWKYQRSSRRWSRKDLIDTPMIENKNGQTGLKSAPSHDSLLTDQNSSSETGDSPVLDSKMRHINDDMVFYKTLLPLDTNGNDTISPKLIKRAGSERLKGAKSFLKRMESLKGSKRGRKPKTITEISGPVITNKADMQEKIKHLNCKEIDGTVLVLPNTGENSEINGSNISANSSLITSPRTEALTVTPPRSGSLRVTSPRSGDGLYVGSQDKTGDLNLPNSAATPNALDNSADLSSISINGALSLDLSSSRQSNSSENSNSSEDTVFSSVEYRPGRFPKSLDDSLFSSDINIRTRSFSYIDEGSSHDSKKSRRGSHDPRHQMHRISIYDNVPVEEDLAQAQQELDIILSELFQNINGLNKAINGENAELLAPPSSSYLDDTDVSIDDTQTPNEPNTDTHSDITHEHDENEVISGTLSSPDISDHELHAEDMSHDDSAYHIVSRDRRDSGVGSSLTRTNSDRRKYRIRWHSFQKSHRPTSDSRALLLCNLSAGQILVLKKLSLLKLTALVEKYSPNRTGWSLTVPRFMKRNKVPDYKDKNVFQVPFSVMIQRTGQALPQCILHAMRFLRRTADDALGIFRKSGVRSRIQKLRNDIEANPEMIDFEEWQLYDVADLVKQYFRELPECLLTNKLSDMFISIFIYVPTELRLEALQAAVVLMADENRDVLQSLLFFLSDIAKHHNKHQMTASNLAVCFAPSLFNMGGLRNGSMTPSPRRNRKNPGVPDARELMEQKAAHECLTVMIQECKKLFTIPAGTLSKCRVWHGDPVMLEELNSGALDGNQGGYTAYIDSCIQGLLKESREKFRGWVSVPTSSDVDVSYKKVGDGHPLRLWKCTVDVEAPPNEVLNRIINDRQMWDEDLLQWNTVEKLDKQTEVFQYVRNSMAPHPTRDYCVLRSWRTDLPKGACVLISTSIEHPNAESMGGIQGVELASRYLIEPCGTGKSRLTQISRVDLRGHSPDWYKKVYGHICANFIEKIRASFQSSSVGPETKV